MIPDEIFEMFSDIKDINDYICEVNTLRFYYMSGQFDLMRQQIDKLTRKYLIETRIWNTINTTRPANDEQAYKSAEVFLQAVGAKMIIEKAGNYLDKLSEEEKCEIMRLAGFVV